MFFFAGYVFSQAPTDAEAPDNWIWGEFIITIFHKFRMWRVKAALWKQLRRVYFNCWYICDTLRWCWVGVSSWCWIRRRWVIYLSYIFQANSEGGEHFVSQRARLSLKIIPNNDWMFPKTMHCKPMGSFWALGNPCFNRSSLKLSGRAEGRRHICTARNPACI